ncbi:MAG: DUF6073 family protein [Acidobacteriota bacterium]
MQRKFILALCLMLTATAFAGVASAEETTGALKSDAFKIAHLVQEFEDMSMDNLASLEPVEIKAYELPDSSVHVMRAVVEETYTVDGIGRDTVELHGWIAVQHSNARPVAGETELRWDTAVYDTEFVGMHLMGESDLFGAVEVKLNLDRPSVGQVGQIQLSEKVRAAIPRLASLGKLPAGIDIEAVVAATEEDADRRKARVTAPSFKLEGSRVIQGLPEGVEPIRQMSAEEQKAIEQDLRATDTSNRPVFCGAEIDGLIIFVDLGLELTTEKATTWYSVVDTIPPRGQVGSVTVEPIALVDNGRKVATLESGVVKFREVVKRVHLEKGAPMHVPMSTYAQADAPANANAGR